MKIRRNAIELLMAKSGMNATALAEKANISQQTLSTMKGRGSCHPATAWKVACALGVDIAEIIEQEDRA